MNDFFDNQYKTYHALTDQQAETHRKWLVYHSSNSFIYQQMHFILVLENIKIYKSDVVLSVHRR